ncbi:MAG: hypothetical protein DI551_00475 [Micavibrio aeruginosavorus]|uniref:Uncharacterized protein n=1 Tax=Micavibrio aeruginosavorus TaxID=349221 RepID=A0A2W5N6P5_9BACT|nr:MAG: hypothetical protein DI551_00475 [Micavibrio aeruginosavorus]
MSRFESTQIVWPPKGWSQFSSVLSSSGQSLAKDIGKSRIYGLQYRIDSVPLFKNDAKIFQHDIRIDGWEYSILNESIEYPVLSFSLLDRFDLSLPRECFVTDIRSYASHVPHTRRSANRAVSAALFFIRQITSGGVPDINRVLRIYKLHPNQAFLYRNDRMLEPDLKRAFTDVRSMEQGHH